MPIKALRTVDRYFIGLLILVFFWLKYIFIWKKDKIVKKPKKILIIRMRALGSSLLTFPMIKQLEGYYGEGVQYDLLASTRNIGVFKNQGYFKKMYNVFSMKDLLKLLISFKKYDIVIDTEEYFMVSAFMSLYLGKLNCGFTNIIVRGLAYNNGITYNDKQHSVLTCLDLIKTIGINYKTPERLEPLIYKESDKIRVDEFLNKIKYNKLICMHTGLAETSQDRAWPKEKWIELIKKVIEKDNRVQIVLSGSKGEYDSVQEIHNNLPKQYQNNVINICGMFSIFGFAYLLEKCDLMISNDTGPMHLAAAMGTKTIGLFGPNLPSRFGPYPSHKNVAIYKGDGSTYIDVHLGTFKKDSSYSIRKITVNDVLNVIF